MYIQQKTNFFYMYVQDQVQNCMALQNFNGKMPLSTWQIEFKIKPDPLAIL